MTSEPVAEAAQTDTEYVEKEIEHGLEPRRVGDTLMAFRNISLSFGGVTAIKDVSFDIRQGEIRAIIGPNGAGKSSMLNVINGFYHPQEGEIRFRGEKRGNLKPNQIARQRIARTFQNIALFKGMSTLDNIMTGRLIHMRRNMFWQALWWGPAAFVAALLVILLTLFSQYTKMGRGLRAVADDHQAALSVGISLESIWWIVWSVAGIVALVAGIMWGAASGVQFSLSLIALKALPVLMLGGFTSIPGAIVGGLIIGAGEKVFDFYIGVEYLGGATENWFAYVIALVFLVFRPQGLFGERIIERV